MGLQHKLSEGATLADQLSQGGIRIGLLVQTEGILVWASHGMAEHKYILSWEQISQGEINVINPAILRCLEEVKAITDKWEKTDAHAR